ncbi:hypothetical protein LCGC14_0913530 [marine sediment metagenome]|uniref:Major facilitator superfamily (MFS) profile domain-containing protein n=1 Tax=marine sediment metagenome TaxID=412755 RepID=A0A0F9NSU4_9ZZZZ
MAFVGVLIGIIIALVVGVSLVPVIVDQVNSLDTEVTPSSVLNLANLLPIIFIAVVIVGAVGFLSRQKV